MSTRRVEVVAIESVSPHSNADTLSIVRMKNKGFQVIVKNGQFREGDRAVYFPPDALIPDSIVEQFNLAYLRKNNRIQTVKLRGELSEGLLLPLDVLPESYRGLRPGADVTAVLGVTFWEPPLPSFAVQGAKRVSAKEVNPYFYRYTDIENIKHFPNVFRPGDPVIVTEKIHGTSFRAGLLPWKPSTWKQKVWYWLGRKYQYCVGSRNVQLYVENQRHIRQTYYGNNVYLQIANRYRLYDILEPNQILFGEIYGGKPRIQDLTYGLDNDIDVVFFDLMENGRFVPWGQFQQFCRLHHLPTVPLVYRGPYYDGLLEQLTSGPSFLAQAHGVHQIREGVVIRDEREIQHPDVGRKILKSISIEYLLRQGGTEYR